MKKVELQTAYALVEKYKETMKSFGVDTPEKGFTASVGFGVKELQEWLHSLKGNATEIKVTFGMYPLKDKEKLSAEVPDAGRFTVLLWPYAANGEPATDESGGEEKPVNVGGLQP